jgi:outer membrane protein OmpA-like peptidoglycan-associated protein
LEVGVQVPVVLWQGGSDRLDRVGLSAPQSSGLGSPWIQARVGFLRERDGLPIDLSLDLLGSVPVGGTAAFTGDLEPSLLPRVGVARTLFEKVRLALELGAYFRVTQALASSAGGRSVSPAVQLGLGASTVDTAMRYELSLRSTIPTDGSGSGVELLAALRAPVGPVELFVAAGPGFGQLPGTPLFRVLGGVAFPDGARPRSPCRANRPHRPEECPALDDDGDGVRNGEDQCPLEAGAASAAGCPDDDGDGIANAADRCPTLAGPASQGGCPDSDQDGLTDEADECPRVAGPKENRGCPWPDGDGDGVPDRDDACPTVAGVAPTGCPPDADQDGVPDAQDKCPTEAGPKEEDGCPPKPQVKLESDRLVIREKVFFDTGKATIQPRSFPLLESVAKVLQAHPEVEHVFIDGHTDARGPHAFNVQLSQARAESVKAWLVQAGVAEERLAPRGFGPDKPLADNRTEAGREQNRRVEFLIETRSTVRETK